MSDNCVNETDLYFIEDFTDPLNLSKLKRRRKMVTIYRNTKNPKRLNQYKKNCFLRDQLLKALNLEAIKQITTWGNMNYDRRLKKLGLIPPSDPEIFKTEYISERSIRFLNVFDNFELVECASYKVGSESSGVSSIHGSEETVCRLSPIAPVKTEEKIGEEEMKMIEELNTPYNLFTIETEEDEEDLKKLKESTTFDNLYNVCPDYNKKYTNINGKLWRKLITIIENYSPTGRPEIPSGTYYGQVNENNKANGYGELVWGDAVIGGRADDTVKERGEMIGKWKNGTPISFYVINRKYNSLIISMEIRDIEDNNKLIYEIKFSTDFGRPINKYNLNVSETISVFSYNLVIEDKLNNLSYNVTRSFPVFKHSSYEGAPTAFLEEYAAKLALFINLVDVESEVENEFKPVIIQLFSLENFNFDDILQFMSLMATQYDLDILKDQFKVQYVKDTISRYINIPDNQYIKRINEVIAEGSLIPLPSRPVSRRLFDEFDEENKEQTIVDEDLPPISPALQRQEDIDPIQVEQYYDQLYDAILDGDMSEVEDEWNNIPQEYHKPVLEFKVRNQKPPIIYEAFNRSVEDDDRECLRFFLEKGANPHIIYIYNQLIITNPIFYYFIKNNYRGEDSELNDIIRSMINLLFEYVDDANQYLLDTQLISYLTNFGVNNLFIQLLVYIRDYRDNNLEGV